MDKKLISKIAIVAVVGTMTAGSFIADGARGNVSNADSIITNGSNSTSLNVNKTDGSSGTWQKSDGVFEYYIEGQTDPVIVLAAEDLIKLEGDIQSLADAVKKTGENTTDAITESNSKILASIGAKKYDANTSYSKGAFVYKDGVLYVIKADGTADGNMEPTTLEKVINNIIENNNTVSDMNGWKFTYTQGNGSSTQNTIKLTHTN